MKAGSRERWIRRAGAVVVTAVLGMGTAAGQNAVPNTVFAGGGGTISAGAFRIHSTIGEAAAGTISSGTLRLTSGFQATFVPLDVEGGPTDGRIFYDGFED
jgi:hypothetical protein